MGWHGTPFAVSWPAHEEGRVYGREFQARRGRAELPTAEIAAATLLPCARPAPAAAGFSAVCRACSTARGESPLDNLMEVKVIAKAQGRRRETGSERSVEQTYEPMYKNRISRHTVPGELATDSEAHIHQRHWVVNSGGCVRKAVELTSGDLFRLSGSPD